LGGSFHEPGIWRFDEAFVRPARRLPENEAVSSGARLAGDPSDIAAMLLYSPNRSKEQRRCTVMRIISAKTLACADRYRSTPDSIHSRCNGCGQFFRTAADPESSLKIKSTGSSKTSRTEARFRQLALTNFAMRTGFMPRPFLPGSLESFPLPKRRCEPSSAAVFMGAPTRGRLIT